MHYCDNTGVGILIVTSSHVRCGAAHDWGIGVDSLEHEYIHPIAFCFGRKRSCFSLALKSRDVRNYSVRSSCL